MAYNRETAGPAMVKFAEEQVGKGYSEQSPAGSDGDGHYWVPGEPLPTVFDCSGLVHSCGAFVGAPISDGNVEEQWLQHLGGTVDPSWPLAPGDIAVFEGSDNEANYGGHTGIIRGYDVATRMFTMINAADEAQGVCVTTSSRDQTDNGDGLAVLGFYRPAASLPPAPAPKPKPVPTRSTLHEGATGEEVKYLQERLNALDKAGLDVDGIFGVLTDGAVKTFQKNHGLPQNGVVDAPVWRVLG